jgi:hypothetical protein
MMVSFGWMEVGGDPGGSARSELGDAESGTALHRCLNFIPCLFADKRGAIELFIADQGIIKWISSVPCASLPA